MFISHSKLIQDILNDPCARNQLYDAIWNPYAPQTIGFNGNLYEWKELKPGDHPKKRKLFSKKQV